MRSRIEVNPGIHFGKPSIAGTRIPVQNVLELIRAGVPFEEIVRDYYPELALDDIRACVQHAIEVLAAEDLHVAVAAQGFFLDQDVYAIALRFLRDLGHQVLTAVEIGRPEATDLELLVIAREQDRVFVTRDRDFGGLP